MSSKEVEERRKEYGYNQVQEKKDNPFLRLAGNLWGMTPWMLEITIIMTWLLSRYLEAYIVIGLLLFNAALSFIQEEKANTAQEFLKQNLQIKARVKRDGVWSLVPARDLVPGDHIRLRAGDFVPADAKVLDGSAEEGKLQEWLWPLVRRLTLEKPSSSSRPPGRSCTWRR